MKPATPSFSLIHSLLFYGILSFISWMAAKNFLLSAIVMLLPLLFYRMSLREKRRQEAEALKAREKLRMNALAIQLAKKLDQKAADPRVTQH